MVGGVQPALTHRVETLGTYRVIRKLGLGGMAEVFLAAQRMEGDVVRPVVIKAMLPHLAEEERFVDMFMREARVAAMLSHPNIVSIHDVVKLKGRPCIILEFLKGRDLWTVMQRLVVRGHAVEPRAAAAVIAQAATALDYAHQRLDRHGNPLDLVHRDVSPHNLFLTRDGRVRVLDFGIAKSAYQEGERTESGVIKGKLPYMSPEQARGNEVDHRTDQFALGVVLWEMLTGERLFARDDALQTMTALFHQDTPAPSSVRPVPPAIERIAMRALEKDPTERFDSCESLVQALREWLGEQDAGPEPKLVLKLLDHAVPVSEDDAFYAPDRGPVSVEDRELIGYEPTPSRGSAIVVTEQPQQRSLSRRRRFGLAALTFALTIGAGFSLGLVLGPWGYEAPSEPAAAALAPASVEPESTPAKAASDATVAVRFAGVPDGVVIEVDGHPVSGTTLELRLRGEPYSVRALFAGHEVWRYDALVRRPLTIAVPVLNLAPLRAEPPAREPPTQASPRSAPIEATPARSDRMRPSQMGIGIVTDYP